MDIKIDGEYKIYFVKLRNFELSNLKNYLKFRWNTEIKLDILIYKFK